MAGSVWARGAREAATSYRPSIRARYELAVDPSASTAQISGIEPGFRRPRPRPLRVGPPGLHRPFRAACSLRAMSAETSPYWNPHTETLARDRLDALQLAQAPRPARLDVRAAPRGRPGGCARPGSSPARCWALDDLPRIPFLERADWMAAPGGGPALRPGARAPAGERDPLPHDLGHQRPPPARGARRHEGLGVDRGDVVLRALGLRRAARRHASSSRSATARSSASGARTTPARSSAPRAPRRQHDHRGARADARRHAAPPSSARPRPTRCAWRRRRGRWASTCPAGPVAAADPVRRAGRLDPRDQGADRGAVGREGGRHRGHDRARHDHHVRVRPPARRRRTSSRTTTSRRSSTRTRASPSPTASSASAW